MLHWVRKLISFIKRIFGIREDDATSVPPDSRSNVVKTGTIPVVPPFTERELELGSSEPPQYRKRESLLTYRERVFYKALLEEMSGEYQIFAKVRLGDIVWLVNEPENRKFHNNQIQCKHIDFLLCDKELQKPLLAIELDDSSHMKFSRQESDEFKRQVCEETGLPLLRIKVQQVYPKGYVGEQARSKLH